MSKKHHHQRYRCRYEKALWIKSIHNEFYFIKHDQRLPPLPNTEQAPLFKAFKRWGALQKIIPHLDGWAFCIAIGAIDTAISFERFKHCAAPLAVIEDLAGICWHGLSFRVATFGTN